MAGFWLCKLLGCMPDSTCGGCGEAQILLESIHTSRLSQSQ